MREMVLNHASLRVPEGSRDTITDWLRHLASGMGQLVSAEVVRVGLRTGQDIHEVPCSADYSLFNAYQLLRQAGYREEYQFLAGLVTKTPLLHEVGEHVEDRFRGCEGKTLPPEDGEPLVLCAITDWIAVGFPTEPIWDRDRITVSFDELLSDGTIGDASEEIDQLTRSAHADPICDRHRARLGKDSDPLTLWENRQTNFPSLAFGPDVEKNLKEHANLFTTIVAKLTDLDQSAREWRKVGGPAPPWRTNVTPESPSVMNNPNFRRMRVFQSHHGIQKTFEWHARFGNNGRIHLRFDPASKEVEIGYIGPHLPLPH